MKIRSGLVSNSSSSSFCVVGIKGWHPDESPGDLIKEICYIAGLDPDEHWCNYGQWEVGDGKPEEFNEITFIGDSNEVYCVGLDVKGRFDTAGLSFDEIVLEFIDRVKELTQITIPKDLIQLHYGESCSS